MFFATVDDVSSAVIDIGREECRAGYSGEDCPRSVIPSYLGILEGDLATDAKAQMSKTADGEDAEMEEVKEPGVRYVTGETDLKRKRDGMRIQPLF